MPEVKTKKPVKKMPAWWLKLTVEQQKAYLLKHPKSPYKLTKKTKKLRDDKPKFEDNLDKDIAEKLDAIEALKAHPEHREEIRTKIDAITESPEVVLPEDFNKKMTEETFNKMSDEDKEEVENHIKDAVKKKSPKSYKKAAIKVLSVLGMAALGGALLATGTLPYAILTAHLLKDAKTAFDDFSQRVDQGENTISAFMGGVGRWTKESLASGTAVAASIIMSTRSNSSQPDKKSVKKQSKTDDKEKKLNTNQTEHPVAKPKPK